MAVLYAFDRWEKLIDTWPVTVVLRDPANPIFKSNRTTYIKIDSTNNLRMNFHPACLLTLGDMQTFFGQLAPTDGVIPTMTVPRQEQPPSEQSGRCPCKLLLNFYFGMPHVPVGSLHCIDCNNDVSSCCL